MFLHSFLCVGCAQLTFPFSNDSVDLRIVVWNKQGIGSTNPKIVACRQALYSTFLYFVRKLRHGGKRFHPHVQCELCSSVTFMFCQIFAKRKSLEPWSNDMCKRLVYGYPYKIRLRILFLRKSLENSIEDVLSEEILRKFIQGNLYKTRVWISLQNWSKDVLSKEILRKFVQKRTKRNFGQ